jgi:hypothetical protein
MPNRCLSKYVLKSGRRERTAGTRTSVAGNRFNNRVAAAGRSDRLHHADGILPKNRLKASAAPALGKADKRAASIHGSEPQRAKAEIMVSVAPLSPVPISANRKFSSLASNWLISYFTFLFVFDEERGKRDGSGDMITPAAFDLAANSLFRISVRGHRSEIMFGVLVVVLRPNPIARLGLSLG